MSFRKEGFRRFQEVIRERKVQLPQHGAWEVAVVFDDYASLRKVDESFLNLINATNPRYTGWPVWVDSRGFVNQSGGPDLDAYPYRHGEGYEAFIFGTGGGIRNALDFWRAEPVGRFYLYRALQDDLSESNRAPQPMTVLDPVLVVLRAAEAIAVPMAFARAMGAPPDSAILSYEFRWSGLRGREISAWANQERFVTPGYTAEQDEADSRVVVPLETPKSAIAPFVLRATAPLFAAFGYGLDAGVIEDLTERLLNRSI